MPVVIKPSPFHANISLTPPEHVVLHQSEEATLKAKPTTWHRHTAALYSFMATVVPYNAAFLCSFSAAIVMLISISVSSRNPSLRNDECVDPESFAGHNKSNSAPDLVSQVLLNYCTCVQANWVGVYFGPGGTLYLAVLLAVAYIFLSRVADPLKKLVGGFWTRLSVEGEEALSRALKLYRSLPTEVQQIVLEMVRRSDALKDMPDPSPVEAHEKPEVKPVFSPDWKKKLGSGAV